MLAGITLGIIFMVGVVSVGVGMAAAYEGDVMTEDAAAGAAAGSLIFGWIGVALLGVWLLIDFFRIIMGKFPDKQGRSIKTR